MINKHNRTILLSARCNHDIGYISSNFALKYICKYVNKTETNSDIVKYIV